MEAEEEGPSVVCALPLDPAVFLSFSSSGDEFLSLLSGVGTAAADEADAAGAGATDAGALDFADRPDSGGANACDIWAVLFLVATTCCPSFVA